MWITGYKQLLKTACGLHHGKKITSCMSGRLPKLNVNIFQGLRPTTLLATLKDTYFWVHLTLRTNSDSDTKLANIN